MSVSTELERYANAEFKYGTLDCCLFVCNVIRDTTGTDYADPFRNRYDSEDSAAKLVAEYGGMVGILRAAFGRVMPVWCVREGDPVMISAPLVESDAIGAGLGIYDGSKIVYLTEKGLAYAPITYGRGCFNV